MPIQRRLNSTVFVLFSVFLIVVGGLVYSTRTALRLRDLIITAERVVGAMYRVTDYNKELIMSELRLAEMIDEWETAINDATIALIQLVENPANNLVGENLRQQILYTQRVWDVARFRFISARQQMGVVKNDNSLTTFQKTGLYTMLRTAEEQGNDELHDRLSRLITALRSFDRDGKTLIVGSLERAVAGLERQVRITTQVVFTVVGIVAAILSAFSLVYVLEKTRNFKMVFLLKRMEVYTMKARMNPHFLYNTLNTGVQLAITEDADRTATFMQNLAHFFRHNVQNDSLIVPLRHEIEGLNLYLDILRTRFSRSLTIRTEIPEEPLDKCFVPTLTLQPIVENSVVHAFRNVERPGVITIRIEQDGDIVSIIVEDNGIGMPRETAEQLLQRHPHEADLGSCSRTLGFENVIQRLYFFFPRQRDIVSIRSVHDQGTKICIRLNTREHACIPSL